MYDPLLITVSLLFAAALAAVGWLLAGRSALRSQLTEARASLEVVGAEKRELDIAVAVARESQAGIERRFDDAHDQLQEAFAALSADALKASSEQFLLLARETLAGEQKQSDAVLARRQQAVEALVKPIHDQLAAATAAIDAVEKSRRQAYGGLKQQIASMVDGQQQLRGETANLVKALRRPEVRGRWGEMQLRRWAELAGMAAHCDFSEQATVSGGALRPDMVVSLPGGREIVIDAKTPIAAYLDAAEADDAATQDAAMGRHVRHIEDKVAELSGKRYQDHFATADFVVLFIPGESFLYAAAQRRPDLLESALARNVVIATPTTLIALLKVVALGWREERLAENAQQIKALGQELHKRVGTLTGHLENLGRAVGKTVEHYNRFVGSYESQLLTQTRRFEALGAASLKPLPTEGTLPAADERPRPLTLATGDDGDEEDAA